MRIYLVGFMGSGKSSLGNRIAARLNYNFIDLDQVIEKQEGKSISEIFEAMGEEGFREIERENLFKCSALNETVISLGGGACCNDLNMNFILESGLCIYLKVSNEILLGRLRQNRSQRPLINNLDDSGLKKFIHDKIMEREVFYNKAHFVCDEKSSMDFLMKQLNNYFK